MAREILNANHVSTANLIKVPTRTVLEVSEVGSLSDPWQQARGSLASCISECDQILLAWGVTSPNGPARGWFREQVEWVHMRIALAGIPVWTVGGAPRHPSRWQRYTSREYPLLAFSEALAKSFQRAGESGFSESP